MVTIMVLVGGSMTLGLAFACAFCRVAAQADVDRDATFARSVHEGEVEHRHCPGLDDAAAGPVAAQLSLRYIEPNPLKHCHVGVGGDLAPVGADMLTNLWITIR